jgi:Kef-type K+ transport system membrane component KefB
MMDHNQVSLFLGILVVILTFAKLGGALAQGLGQPAVLGELVGGILAGPSALGWVDPHHEALQLLAELGVLILLFAIGLETDLAQLLRVGMTSMTVAVVGVFLPFALGYAACLLLGLSDLRSIMAAATLTATSVGITARVLSDLGHLRTPEGQIILGAALIDDVLGLLLLTIIEGFSEGQRVSATMVLGAAGRAIGFLVMATLVGRWVVPHLFRMAQRIELPGTITVFAVVLALSMAWLADRCGSAMIIGAFAGGLLLAGVPRAHEIERGIAALGHFLVPIFFVSVGASVDLGALDPFQPASRFALLVGVVLIAVGIVGKLLAGYAPFWFRGNKTVIGVGMIPRGEVGLIFARIGLASHVFDPGLFGAATLMVMVTTLVVPPCLKRLLETSAPSPVGTDDVEAIQDLVTEA